MERALSPVYGNRQTSYCQYVIPDIAGEDAYVARRARHISGIAVTGSRIAFTLTKPSSTSRRGSRHVLHLGAYRALPALAEASSPFPRRSATSIRTSRASSSSSARSELRGRRRRRASTRSSSATASTQQGGVPGRRRLDGGLHLRDGWLRSRAGDERRRAVRANAGCERGHGRGYFSRRRRVCDF